MAFNLLSFPQNFFSKNLFNLEPLLIYDSESRTEYLACGQPWFLEDRRIITEALSIVLNACREN